MNPYEELGVPQDATREEIRAAYRRKAAEAHPDRGGDAAAMARANHAWRLLKDERRRSRYDRTGNEQTVEPSLDTMAGSCLAEHFAMAIDRLDESVNLVSAVNEGLSQLRNAKSRELMELTAKFSADKRRRKRFLRRGRKAPRNIADAVFEQRARDFERNIEATERLIKVVERAQEFLSDYEWKEIDEFAPMKWIQWRST